jgi:hypothetical protein
LEYRLAEYGRQEIDVLNSSGMPDGDKVSFAPDVQTFTVSLVHHFGAGN